MAIAASTMSETCWCVYRGRCLRTLW